jgi:hypothetical protein
MNVWRCTTCEKLSQAAVRPKHHRRRGQQCGPFEAWSAVAPGTVVEPPAPAPVIQLDGYRQSLLASFEVCPRRTYHSLITPDDLAVGYVGATGELGTMVHAVFAEIVRTLYRQGETQISTQEAIEIMYEVYAASPIVLPAEQRDTLVWLTLRFAEVEIPARRVMALEQRLTADIVCQDGEVRTLTGAPDVLIADPPDGLIIRDYKSGQGKPRTPRGHKDGETIEGEEYLSDRGHFQGDVYALLAMKTYPQAQRVTFEEIHLRSGEIRRMTLTRPELEHVERMLSVHMIKLDRGIAEGERSEVWRPRPGKQCLRQCPVAASCPVPQEQRGIGALASTDDADVEAKRYIVIDGLRQQMRDRLKAFNEETDHAPVINDDLVLRWKDKPTGGRAWGPCEPEQAPDPAERARRDEEWLAAAQRAAAENAQRRAAPVPA